MAGDFDTVKERIDLVALVGERVPLKKAGKVYKGLCPFHIEKTPSFQVDPERRNYHCFGCGESGDCFTWMEKQFNLEPVEALRTLAERAGVELSGKQRTPEDKKREERLRSVMDTALFYFRQGLRSPDHGKASSAYLVKRGIAPETIERFGLGYAPDLWDGLLSYIKKKGFSEEEGVTAGLLRVRDGNRGFYDWFRGRLMVPIRDSRGRVIAFAGRAMRADEPAKYVNSPNTPLFTKSATLFALDLAKASIRAESSAVIVEGQFDAISSHQAGLTNVVASMGTALTQEQYRVLQDMKLERIVVAFDGDAAGQNSAEKRGRELLPLLQRHGQRAGSGEVGTRGFGTLYVTVLPTGMDPDDLARRDPGQLKALISGAASLLEFLIAKIKERSDLGRPEGRLRFVEECAAVLAAEPDPVRREVYLSTVAASAGVDPATVRAKVDSAGSAPVRTAPRPLASAPEPESGRDGKQTPTQERYVMALLTRYPEEIARLDLVPDDLESPELRDLLIYLQSGNGSLSQPPAHLAATVAALGASAPELGEETDPGQVIEIAARRLRVMTLQHRWRQLRAEFAQRPDDRVLGAEVERVAAAVNAAQRALESRTVLDGEMERRESE